MLIDNYGPGVLERMGLGYEALQRIKPGVLHCGIKGFLSGPYENRNLLDEPAQMMGGLAYMTGPPGMPLRAGASVVDLTGAMFSVIGILAALLKRGRDGQGNDMRVGLFETAVFLVSQHIAKAGISGEVPAPMTERGVGQDLGWGIYRVFETRDRRHVFIGVTSDVQWEAYCREFGLDDLWAEEELRNNGRPAGGIRSIDPAHRGTGADLGLLRHRRPARSGQHPPRPHQYADGLVRAPPSQATRPHDRADGSGRDFVPVARAPGGVPGLGSAAPDRSRRCSASIRFPC